MIGTKPVLPAGEGTLRPKLWLSLGLLLAIVATHLLVGIQALDKPGLYMDAVDPDYLVARVVNPQSPTEYWLAPGNLLFGRFPILAGPYSGTYVLYLLVPFYLLLGGTLTAIRIGHIALGLAVLVATFIFLRETTRSLTFTTIVVGVLAVDPAFILPFRTQAYIVLFPVSLAVFGMYALYRYRTVTGNIVAGTLFGLSIFGYFVFGFFLPGIVVFCLTNGLPQLRKKHLLALFFGIAVGVLPYVLGYGLLFGALGFAHAIEYIRNTVFLLHVNDGQSYLERFMTLVGYVWEMLTGAWDSITFWGTSTTDTLQTIKVSVLLLLPLAALPFSFNSSSQSTAFRLAALSTVSYFLVATILGGRLGGHDLTPLLPLLYILAASSLCILAAAPLLRKAPVSVNSVAVVGGAILFAFNTASTAIMMAKLSRESGVGLFSSVLSDYPKIALERNEHTPHIFWQWGSLFQFIYLTEGQIPAYSSGGLRGALCQYGKAKIVLTGDETAHHPDIDFSKLGVKVNAVDILHDVHSGFPYEIIAVTPLGDACQAPHSAASFSIPVGLQLPEGVTVDASRPYEGIYPASPGGCCFLAELAKFSVRVPPAARNLRFDVYAPSYPQLQEQRLTFVIGKETVTQIEPLKKGVMTSIDVPVPKSAIDNSVTTVQIVPSTSFVPKELGVDGDYRRVSVVLSRVAGTPTGHVAPDLPEQYDYMDGVFPPIVPTGLFVDGSTQCCFAGPRVAFRLKVPTGSQQLQVTLYQPPLSAHLGKDGSMVVTFDDSERVSVPHLEPGKLRTYAIDLPSDARGKQQLDVVITFAKTFVPKEEGINGDTRRLSVVIRRVAFSAGRQRLPRP